jgi:hypothetical protein
MTKKEYYGYRVGAVQCMDGFCEIIAGAHYRRNDILKYISNPVPFDLSTFSKKTVKKALKCIKTDYPKQYVRFGTFIQTGHIYLAIQPERPNHPDQWMIVGQEIPI